MTSVVSLPVEILEIRLTTNREYPWTIQVLATVKVGNRPRPEVIALDWNPNDKLWSDLIHIISSQYLHEERMHDLEVRRRTPACKGKT